MVGGRELGTIVGSPVENKVIQISALVSDDFFEYIPRRVRSKRKNTFTPFGLNHKGPVIFTEVHFRKRVGGV